MTTKLVNYLEEQVTWDRGTDPNYPYEAEIGGDKLMVRLNDFPSQNLYTLIVNSTEVTSFDDWPAKWKKPMRLPARSSLIAK